MKSEKNECENKKRKMIAVYENDDALWHTQMPY